VILSPDAVLGLYVRTWALALGWLPSARGWLLVGCLVALPLLLAGVIRLLAWHVVDGLTGGRLAQRDVERFERRHGRGW
jgi:hypothetical protein